MTGTVTIDKAYFETLLRRAEFHVSGEDLTTPLDLPTVSIPKCDHDNLLRIAREYSTLREALYRGGISRETLEVLIRHDSPNEPQFDGYGDASGGIKRGFVGNSQLLQAGAPSCSNQCTPTSSGLFKPGRNTSGNIWSPDRRGSNGRQHSFSPDDASFPSDPDKEDQNLAIPSSEKQQYARTEQRTINIKNLSDRAVHKDIVDIVRGGAVLDIYLRSNDRAASVSFVEGSAAQAFMTYVKRNDIYVHGKRAEFCWNDRQFILPGHVAGKIQAGATRNMVIRSVHPNITANRIRDDLDHIHNLVVVEVSFRNGDAFISLNSVHNSLFARTCMMSRATYKGCRIEWYADECAQPLQKVPYVLRKESATPSVRKNNTMINRFETLNIDGTEDGSEDGAENNLTGFTPMRPETSWAASTLAA